VKKGEEIFSKKKLMFLSSLGERSVGESKSDTKFNPINDPH
jgi:hypothetical protein